MSLLPYTNVTPVGTQQVDIVGQSGADPLNVKTESSEADPVIVQQSYNFNATDANIWYFRQNGNGTEDMRGNYSGGNATEFSFIPTRDFLVTALHLTLGAYRIDQNGHSNWGSLSGLSNGIRLMYDLDGRSIEINHVRRLFNNRDIMAQSSKYTKNDFPRSGDECTLYQAQFDLSHLPAGGVLLDSSNTDKIYTVLNDDFSFSDANVGLTEMSIQVIGQRLAP